MQQLTDLREILRYVPHFRDKVFVIALDGAVVADENLATSSSTSRFCGA